MDAQTPEPSVDLAIAALARAQHGVVAWYQLIASGVARGAIQHRIATGRLHRVHRGVYAVGHMKLTPQGFWMAAVLACGPAALLSHRSAGALWGIAPYSGRWIDVTVAGSSRRRREGIVIHGCQLVEDDRALEDSIPVTSVARTLLDLAEVVDERRLERAFEAAERMRLLDLRAIDRVCRRSQGRRGLHPLLSLLPSLGPAPRTRSDLERDFLDFCREHRLPAPIVNAYVAGFEVDALWSEARLVVELDSFEFHRTRAAFERDRARDVALQVAGHQVVRLTHRGMTAEPDVTAAQLRSLLEVRGRDPAG